MYTFDQIFAADPSNPANVAVNGVVTIFAPGDGTKTPVAITTTTGAPLANPVIVNDRGFGPAFMHATLDRLAWEGGDFTGFFTSYEGMKEEAVAARQASEASAGESEASAQAARDAAALVDAPVDTNTAGLIQTEGTATRAALNATIASTFRGVPGKRYRTIAGVLRNTGTGWGPIQDATHEPSNFGSVETSATQITLNYPEINGLKVVSLVATCDEVLADAGFTVGASVEKDRTFLRIHRTSPVSDYVTYNGTGWTSANGSSTFEPMSPGGVLQINHQPVGNSSNIYDVSLTSRGGALTPILTGNGPAITLTAVRVEFKDWAGATQSVPTTDMRLFYSHSGHGTVDPTTITTTSFPGSNIWVMGVFEVSD